MKNKEIERKFLIDFKNVPFDLKKMIFEDITQGYITSEKDLIYRLRHIIYRSENETPLGEAYYQTIKGKGSKIRDEFEIQLLKEQFTKMWKLCERLTIHKWRYDLPNNTGQVLKAIHLDFYKNELRGLWTIEVEFETEDDCDKFIPPTWFDKELTHKFEYTNLNLALNGLPADFKK